MEFKSNISRKELFYLLYNAEYYISASQIENSSIAALEALLLCKNIVLSNIPSHLEMLRKSKTKKLVLENSKMDFIDDLTKEDSFLNELKQDTKDEIISKPTKDEIISKSSKDDFIRGQSY